jgi:hypothetical protein
VGYAGRVREFLKQDPKNVHTKQGPYRGELLHVAADKGRVGIVKLLLDHGVDVNVESMDGKLRPCTSQHPMGIWT